MDKSRNEKRLNEYQCRDISGALPLDVLWRIADWQSRKVPSTLAGDDLCSLERVKNLSLAIVEDASQPCDLRLKAAEIAVMAIEAKINRVMDEARWLGERRRDHLDELVIRYRGQLIGQ